MKTHFQHKTPRKVPLLKGLEAWSCKSFDSQIIFWKCEKSLHSLFQHLLQLPFCRADSKGRAAYGWLSNEPFLEVHLTHPCLVCSIIASIQSHHPLETTRKTWSRCSCICDNICMKQHMLVTYSIFKLQIKIPVVCLKLSLFLCKEEKTCQTCLKVSTVNTDIHQEKQAELLKDNVTRNLCSVQPPHVRELRSLVMTLMEQHCGQVPQHSKPILWVSPAHIPLQCHHWFYRVFTFSWVRINA